MVVHARIEPLKWESHFFHLHSGIVRFSENEAPLEPAALTRFQRVQAKIPASRPDWLDALQQLDFHLVEEEVDLVLTVGDAPDHPDVIVAQPSDIPVLRQKASAAFALSRFREPWYQAGDSSRFYAQWIENAVYGHFDNDCLLVRSGDGDIRGFVSMRQLNDSDARIGLLAGQGEGASLMSAAQHWCLMRGITTLRVATQIGNSSALRRYIKSGATIESTAYWLYR